MDIDEIENINELEDNESETTESFLEKYHDKYSDLTSYIFILIVFINLIIMITVTICYNIINESTHTFFWINQLTKYISIFIIQLVCGLLVKLKNIKTNYTRTIMHISYFIIPQLLDTLIIPFDKTIYTELWNITIIYILLLLMLDKIRNKFNIFKIMYSAIDRPEDRPYTNFWFITQLSVSLPIIMGFSVLFSSFNSNYLIFIPIYILAFGDGLAEPIGTKFGKNKYKVKGFLVNETYTRSIEGSLCVYFVSLISILGYYTYFSKASLTFCLTTVPYLLTLVEAFSPHTWDNPLILLSGYILMTCSYYL